ncbi:unnamed protein product [Mycena citricolor]|uniref:Uncharacterized protein n=1 Tax=Mycena citricolor TaxID=2018698 RepID=A0AAD2K8I0_9AGAR|nr:unnamed protein product [Mycena citricolor]
MFINFKNARKLLLATIILASATTIVLSLYLKPSLTHPHSAYVLVAISDLIIFGAFLSIFRKSLFLSAQTVSAEALGSFVLLPFALILLLYTMSLSLKPDPGAFRIYGVLQVFVLISVILHGLYTTGLIATAMLTVCCFDVDVWTRDIDSSPSPFPMSLISSFICPCFCVSANSAEEADLAKFDEQQKLVCQPGTSCTCNAVKPKSLEERNVEMGGMPRASLLSSRSLVRVPNELERRTSIIVAFDEVCDLLSLRSPKCSCHLHIHNCLLTREVAMSSANASLTAGKLPLRIFYTVNGSPQRMLTRTNGVVPVDFIYALETEGTSSRAIARPRYASTSLRVCLESICRSSPELLRESTVDYSVYLLDPMETAPVDLPGGASPKQQDSASPVAVGLGLLSVALMEHEGMATGTVKAAGGRGRESLEIIFSLTQTVSLSAPLSLPWANTSAPSKAFPPSSANHPKAAPVTHSDKLLNDSSYVGPERRRPGRPGRPKQTVIVDEDKDRKNTPLANSASVSEDVESVRHVLGVVSNDGPALLDLIAFVQTQPSHIQHKALADILRLVHGKSGEAIEPAPELIEAIRHFKQQFSDFASHRPQENLPSLDLARRKSASDDEIVVLNKENVNPKVFSRKGSKEKQADPSDSRGLLERTLTQSGSSTPDLPTSTLGRKRTRTEYMGEQSETVTASITTSYYRLPERSYSQPLFTASSPVKDPSHATAKASVSASSPPRPARKKYIVPDWARTKTSLQPRLSAAAQLRAQEREQEEEERRKTKAEARRKQAKDERDKSKTRKPKGKGVQRSASQGVLDPSKSQGASVSRTLSMPAPIAAGTDFLLFGSLSRSSAATTVPCTPPRKRMNTFVTPDRPGSCPNSLFTPGPGSKTWGDALEFDSGRRSASPTGNKSTQSPSADMLAHELESAFEDLDVPTFPSSDQATIMEAMSEDDSDEDGDGNGNGNVTTEKQIPQAQHWEGLPPSSPPPPSSPIMMTSDDVALSADVEPLSDPGTAMDACDTDLFAEFMNYDFADSAASHPASDWGLDSQAPSQELDINQLWETLCPLIQDTKVDPVDMAIEVHALFNGCLV